MKKAAIIIGQQGGGDFRRLLGVDNDIADMHSFIQYAGGYDLVQTVRDRPKGEILAVVDHVVSRLTAGDRLLIYFTGHGHSVNGQHVLVCNTAKLAQLEFFHEVIPVQQLRRATDGLGLDRSLIIDSCWDTPYVASLTRGAPPRMSASEAQNLKNIGAQPNLPTMSGITGSFSLFCACAQDQVAVEIPGLNRGLFTAAVIDVLRSCSKSGREVRLSDQLKSDVVKRMSEIGREYQLPFVPVPLHSVSGEPGIIIDGTSSVSSSTTSSSASTTGASSSLYTADVYTSVAKKADMIVSQDGRGDYRTITEAINAAADGMTIKVKPGVYREGLIMDKSVHIFGDGPVEQIVVQSDKAGCIRSTKGDGSVIGITLRSTAGANENKIVPIVVHGGRLLIEDCDITSNAVGYACVLVQGKDADPIIRRCKIHDSPNCGVQFAHSARGTVEDCDIYGHVNQGLVIHAGGDPVVRRCKIHHNMDTGVQLFDQCKGVVEDCDIYNNTTQCVTLKSGADPVFRRCKIHASSFGVHAFEEGKGLLEDCDIYDCVNQCISILTKANPVLRRCKIHDGQSCALYVLNEGIGLLEDCSIFGFGPKHAAISLGKQCSPTLRRCNIHHNKANGIFLAVGATGLLDRCTFNDNAYPDFAGEKSGLTIR